MRLSRRGMNSLLHSPSSDILWRRSKWDFHLHSATALFIKAFSLHLIFTADAGAKWDYWCETFDIASASQDLIQISLIHTATNCSFELEWNIKVLFFLFFLINVCFQTWLRPCSFQRSQLLSRYSSSWFAVSFPSHHAIGLTVTWGLSTPTTSKKRSKYIIYGARKIYSENQLWICSMSWGN